MVLLFRTLFIYPFIFLFKKLIKYPSFFIGFFIFSIILIINQNYQNNNYPNHVAESSDNSINQYQQNVQENFVEEVIIKKGDTLGEILRRQNLPNNDIRQLIKLAKEKKITSKLKIGQSFLFYYNSNEISLSDSFQAEERKTILDKMVFRIDKINSIEFTKQKNNKFIANKVSAPLKKLITQYKATIDSNVISSLKKVGMHHRGITKLVNAYTHQIDFQRQIRSGDQITVLTEKFVDDKNQLSHYGNILYASIKTKNNEYNIYRYSSDKKLNNAQFFSEQGNSIKTNLLRTPVKVARISGRFGYRKKHPVLGYGAMHKGVDFAGSVGTPIYAAGDGVVKFIGWKSGYGRFILIKHNNRLSTAYAHASKFAKNLKRGSRVKQGDIIAFIGKSGRVTGPHLHYEVRINGKQVNPLKFKSNPGVRLKGVKFAKFKKFKESLKSLSKDLDKNIEIAASEIKKLTLF